MGARQNAPRRRFAEARVLSAAALCALAIASPSAMAGVPDDGTRGAGPSSPGDGTRQRPSDVGWALDLTSGDDLDVAALDARGGDLPGAPATGRLVAHEVLAGLLAWEAGRGLGDGAHARPVVGIARAKPFAAASADDVPALGAALATGTAPVERYRHDALDLSLEGPPALPRDIVIDDVPGLSFERRTLYQAATGRLFVDFRLRHRDPGHGAAALEDEARTAAAIARMRSLSTLVLEP